MRSVPVDCGDECCQHEFCARGYSTLAMSAVEVVSAAPDMFRAFCHSRWRRLPMRTWRSVATWAGVAALLCQVLLPLSLAPWVGAFGGDASLSDAQTEHYHDPNLANTFGRDWLLQHSHAGDRPAGAVRVDHGYLTPLLAISPPTELAVSIRWVAQATELAAPALPAAASFIRPLPRAPPPAG